MRKGNLRKTISAVLSFLLVLSMCFIAMPGEVRAAGAQIIISADKEELVPGDTVTVTVTLAGNTDAYGLSYELLFDESRLELKESDIQEGPACTGAMAKMLNLKGTNIVSAVIARTDLIPNAVIMTLPFKVKANATSGSVGISTGAVKVSNENAEDITGTVQNINNASAVAITVPTNSITLDRTTLDLTKGATAKLVATIDPPDPSVDVSWNTSAPSVATVEADGTVTAVGGGTATITASAGGKSASCVVNVNVPLKGIKITGGSSLLKDQALPLTITFDPVDATVADNTIVWKSSDPTVATVDTAGVVTGIKAGTVNIIASTTTTPALTDQVTVTVTEKNVPADFGDQLAFDETQDSLYKGTTKDMNELLNLDELAKKDGVTDTFDVTWSSSDPDVATVNADGVVTVLKKGKTTITAQIVAKDGSGKQTGTYTVTTEIEVVEVPLESIVFNKEIKTMTVGASDTLSIVYNPKNTTDLKEVNWVSSDPSILTVDSTGKIKAVKAGTAKITATSKVNESISCTCEITVTDAADKPGETPGGETPNKPGENPGSETPSKPGQNPGGGTPSKPGQNPGGGTPSKPGQNSGGGISSKPGQNSSGGTSTTSTLGNTTKPGNTNVADTIKPGNNANGLQGDSTNKNNESVAPKTGDSTDIVLYVALVMASIVGITAFSQKRKNIKSEKK